MRLSIGDCVIITVLFEVCNWSLNNVGEFCGRITWSALGGWGCSVVLGALIISEQWQVYNIVFRSTGVTNFAKMQTWSPKDKNYSY